MAFAGSPFLFRPRQYLGQYLTIGVAMPAGGGQSRHRMHMTGMRWASVGLTRIDAARGSADASMHIDTFTVLLVGLLLKLPLCVLFLLFWFTGRRASGFLWWSLAMLFGGVAGVLFMARGFTSDFFS